MKDLVKKLYFSILLTLARACRNKKNWSWKTFKETSEVHRLKEKVRFAIHGQHVVQPNIFCYIAEISSKCQKLAYRIHFTNMRVYAVVYGHVETSI